MKKWISRLFYLLIIIFISFYINNLDFSKLENINFNYISLITATTLALIFRYWGAFVWFQILKQLGVAEINNLRVMLHIYAKSWLGRYIPGKIGWIAGKIFFASEQGISKSKLAVSSILEGSLQILITINLSLIFFLLDDQLSRLSYSLKLTLIVISIVLTLLLIPIFFNKLLKIVFKIFKKEMHEEDAISLLVLLKGGVLYGVGFLITGLSYFFFVKSITNISFEHFFFIVATFNLAGAIGMAALITPSGLGVREGIQLLFLTLIINPELALIITIVARIWSLIVDLSFFGLTHLFNKHKIQLVGSE